VGDHTTAIRTGQLGLRTAGVEVAPVMEQAPNHQCARHGSVWRRLGAQVEVAEALDPVVPGVDVTISYRAFGRLQRPLTCEESSVSSQADDLDLAPTIRHTVLGKRLLERRAHSPRAAEGLGRQPAIALNRSFTRFA